VSGVGGVSPLLDSVWAGWYETLRSCPGASHTMKSLEHGTSPFIVFTIRLPTVVQRAARVSVLSLLWLSGTLGQAPSAQSLSRADTLFIAGRIFAAESLYYDAVRQDPRDPVARLALGRYLAARGALRVGAVLMEEARYFGGDARTVAEELAPVYEQLGEFRALASLPASQLPYGERARAEWLRDNPASVDGPDSARVAYRVTDGQLLGRMQIIVGGDTVMATIDGRTDGLVLDTSWVRRPTVRRFGTRADRDTPRAVGVAAKVQIGEMTLVNVLTRFAPQRSATSATIGLSLLGRLAPTFDPMSGVMVLRKSGRLPPDMAGYRIPTITVGSGISVVKPESVFPIGHPDIQRYLRSVRWTLDPRRGDLVVDVSGSAANGSP